MHMLLADSLALLVIATDYWARRYQTWIVRMDYYIDPPVPVRWVVAGMVAVARTYSLRCSAALLVAAAT